MNAAIVQLEDAMHAAVITAIYDRYDVLKPTCPQVGARVEWICVTDDPGLDRGDSDPLGWRIVFEPRPGLHPNRAAKHPKMRPHLYTTAPSSVWVDASFRVLSAGFVVDVLGFADPIAQFVHPWRECLFTEAEVSAPLPKYADEPCLEQAARYRAEGHPPRWGLWATGVIARRHDDLVAVWGQTWLNENLNHSFQDQISHPHVCRTHGLRPAALPGNHLTNPWLRYEGSARH